jgi:hypothetical protein
MTDEEIEVTYNETRVPDNTGRSPANAASEPADRAPRRRDGLLWIVLIAGIALILSAASCAIGFVVLPPILAPTPTPTPRVGTAVRDLSVQEIQSMAELATVKYSITAEVSDVRIPDDLRQALGIKEEMLLLAYGEVAAGFDLDKLQEEDIWIDGARVQLHLPAPEILYSRLDTERTRVVYYQKSLFVQRDINMEARARQEAEKAIREEALNRDILEQAQKYGELFFSNWLRSMGFREVRVIVG